MRIKTILSLSFVFLFCSCQSTKQNAEPVKYRITDQKGKKLLLLDRKIPAHNKRLLSEQDIKKHETHNNRNSLFQNNRENNQNSKYQTENNDLETIVYSKNKRNSIPDDKMRRLSQSKKTHEKNKYSLTSTAPHPRDLMDEDRFSLDYDKDINHDSDYYVNAGTFVQKSKAQNTADKIKQSLGVPVEPKYSSRSHTYSVSIGPLSSKEDANVMKKELNKIGIEESIIILE